MAAQRGPESKGRRTRDVGARRLPPLREADGVGVRAEARRGVRHLRGPARARRGRGHRQRGHPRRRGRCRGRGVRPHAGELRGRPPRGPRPRRRARVGRGRRRGASVRRRRVRRRHLLRRRDLRPEPPGGGRRAAARVPAGRDDRHDQLHARGAGGRVLRAVGRYAPPPGRERSSPTLWGSEEHVRELFGDRGGVARADPRGATWS